MPASACDAQGDDFPALAEAIAGVQVRCDIGSRQNIHDSSGIRRLLIRLKIPGLPPPMLKDGKP